MLWRRWLPQYTRYAPGTAAPPPEAFRGMLRAGRNPRVNDGRSLAFLDDASVDFVFSWDSLVHADADVCRAFILVAFA